MQTDLNNMTSHDFQLNDPNMDDLFGEDPSPSGVALPAGQQEPYEQGYGQQYDQTFGQSDQQDSRQAYDPNLFGEQAALPAQQQQPYQQGYGQQYDLGGTAGEQQYSQQVYPPHPAAQQGYAASALPAEYQQPYQQQPFQQYQTPIPEAEVSVTKAAPMKRKRRAPQKAPKKTVKQPSPAPETDGVDYSTITELIPSENAASTRPSKKYWTFMNDHLDFVILRFASVCVGLCRFEMTDEAETLGQFAVDFFSKELWDIAVKHYVTISKDGDDLGMMKACMADCIGTYKEFYKKDVAHELQNAVSLLFVRLTRNYC